MDAVSEWPGPASSGGFIDDQHLLMMTLLGPYNHI